MSAQASGAMRAGASPSPATEAAELFARLGTLADEVLFAIARGDELALHAALDERDHVGRRLDPLVVAIRADGIAQRMSGAAGAEAELAGEAAAAVWGAAREAQGRHDALVREVDARREAVARELAGIREARGSNATYRAASAVRGPRLDLVR